MIKLIILVVYLVVGAYFGVKTYKNETEEIIDVYYWLGIILGSIMWGPGIIVYIINGFLKKRRKA